MKPHSPQKLAEWKARASSKGAVVPVSWVVHSSRRVDINCGGCKMLFVRNFVPKVNDPTFICPHCQTKNFVPIQFKKKL